jgi:Pyruvate/2-oxoacid:ferredoxin oxidoreductase gamma subunit
MMMRLVSVLTLLCATVGCVPEPAGPAQTPFQPSSPAAFAGAWRSVTPSLEFMGLSVTSKSSEMGVLAARLTFSGVAWEGGGRLAGDSLVANMTMVGAPTATGVLVAHARDAETLSVQFRSEAAAPLAVTFVRHD